MIRLLALKKSEWQICHPLYEENIYGLQAKIINTLDPFERQQY